MRLEENSPVLKLLQRIRDESHRFAVSYHETLARRRQTASLLDGIPGVGPATRKQLVRQFGSARAASKASKEQLIDVLGDRRGQLVYRYLNDSAGKTSGY